MREPIWVVLLLLALVLQNCVDPVVPEYDYRTGFYLIEGKILDEAGLSEVRISRSELLAGNYRLRALGGVRVSSVDGSGKEIDWIAGATTGTYQPDGQFVAVVGQTYRIRVETPDGQVIESAPEKMPVRAMAKNLRMTFDQEAYFSTDANRFIPTFSLVVDVDNVADQDNFYQFQYRSWSQAVVCATCDGGVYRNGSCVAEPGVIYYDYPCDRLCWSIDRGTEVNIVSDEFNTSGKFTALTALQFPYVGSGGLLVELNQTAISRAAYLYYDKLEELTEGSSGLNAPLPAALYGNLSNTSDPDDIVLGFVAVGAVSNQRLYWNRDTVPGEPLSRRRPLVLEPAFFPITAPCSGPNFTPIKPEGWPN